ncbi:M23 family metallopeptidase [Kribbella sp. CA-293567]|uniref:M23 family metallopeptidase n=1 Tax=Kribbella sp. CA-293567 TaxID=3002436 RepID=UPI0022DE7AEF|nr:M23 family metallopeptidase [Kribbella sp. CA-293567]WBQ04435.1 M23 family metallopeptidase [Kribbella sp. CA-293567]
MPRRALVALAALALTASAAVAAGSAATADSQAAAPPLGQAVAAAMVGAHGQQAKAYFRTDYVPAPVVEPQRTNGQWAFGTTVIPIPADAREQHGTPESAIFLARSTGKGWQVAFDGTAEFRTMARQAPDSVLSKAEKDLFTTEAKALAENTGLALPWKQGATWGWGGGPHGYGGNTRPFSSIDFGGNGQVLAAAPGRVYKSCRSGDSALVTVVHTNGYRTSYYHMSNLTTLADGAAVQTGTYLGTASTRLPCGGSANGAHVHFTLLNGSGSYVAVNGKTIGGWTFYEGAQAYGGYAKRGGTISYPGSGRLTNYGIS